MIRVLFVPSQSMPLSNFHRNTSGPASNLYVVFHEVMFCSSCFALPGPSWILCNNKTFWLKEPVYCIWVYTAPLLISGKMIWGSVSFYSTALHLSQFISHLNCDTDNNSQYIMCHQWSSVMHSDTPDLAAEGMRRQLKCWSDINQSQSGRIIKWLDQFSKDESAVCETQCFWQTSHLSCCWRALLTSAPPNGCRGHARTTPLHIFT